MDGLIHAAILGIVQGLTEFLPISSSAHLIVIPKIFGWTDPFLNSAAFDVMLHMGTLLALVVYFWRDLWRYLEAWIASIRERSIGADLDRRLAWLILISTIPAAIIGAAFESTFDTAFRDALAWIGVFSLIGAAFLWLAERWGRRDRGLDRLNVRDAVTVGLAQAFALFPGISRSGVTIGTGLFLNLERETAARFAFLMSVPVIAGAGLWKARTLVGTGLEGAAVGELLVGVTMSALFGFISIAFLLSYLRRNSLGIFIAYRVVFAFVVFAFVLSR